MTTIMPKGDSVRRAIRWISEERKSGKSSSVSSLVSEATMKFDLNPLEGEFLSSELKRIEQEMNS